MPPRKDARPRVIVAPANPFLVADGNIIVPSYPYRGRAATQVPRSYLLTSHQSDQRAYRSLVALAEREREILEMDPGDECGPSWKVTVRQSAAGFVRTTASIKLSLNSRSK